MRFFAHRAPRRGRDLSVVIRASVGLAGLCLLALSAPAHAAPSSVKAAKAGDRLVEPTKLQQSMLPSPTAKALPLPPTPTPKPELSVKVASRIVSQIANLPNRPRQKGLPGVAEKAAKRYGVDPDLVHAVILTESRYQPEAQSHKGAMGLMQLMPATARLYGVKDPWSPSQNIDGGVRHLRDLLRHYDDIELALAAYNAGKGAVKKYGNTIPPYKETQTYVARAISYMDKLKSGASIDKLRRSGAGVSKRLSGWGIIFGSFFKKDQARAVIKKNRKIMGAALKGGRSVVVKRQFAGLGPYNAMIVGLKQAGAVNGCRSLRQSGGYCLAIPPKQLTDKRAIWR